MNLEGNEERKTMGEKETVILNRDFIRLICKRLQNGYMENSTMEWESVKKYRRLIMDYVQNKNYIDGKFYGEMGCCYLKALRHLR